MTEAELSVILEYCKRCIKPADENQRLPKCCDDLPDVVKELQQARELLRDWTAAYEHPDEPEGLYNATRAFLGEGKS
jgi:hypothetical protein